MTCEQWFRRELEGKFSTYHVISQKRVQIVCHSDGLPTILNFFTLPLEPCCSIPSFALPQGDLRRPILRCCYECVTSIFPDESKTKGIDSLFICSVPVRPRTENGHHYHS